MSTHKPAAELDEKKIDAIFAEVNQCHLPGAAVGIAIGGTPVYRKGFGLANMELPMVLSPTIRMRIGSTTKHFASLAYMLLCEEGKAGIDDPIGKYLPELHPIARQVTMRQLMGHIGGLRDTFDICFLFSGAGRAVPSADLLSIYRDIDDVNDAPGTTWSYNNGGYLMLTFAIERITGQSLEDVLRERIFEPVGMHDTLLRRFDTDFVPNSATLHMRNPSGGFEKSYMGIAIAGEGGMASTVDDMLRWLAHMDAPVVGNAATWKTMKTPQKLANGASTGYGLGLMMSQYRGADVLRHGGGVLAGNSEMLKVPAAGLDVAIMVNRSDVMAAQLAEKILDACLPELQPVTKRESRPFVTGAFRSPTTGRVIQLFAKDEKQFASIDALDIQVEADNDGVLWPAGVSKNVKQIVTMVGDHQRPASLRLSSFGAVEDLILIPPVEKPSVSAIAGRYRSNTTGTEVTICEHQNGPRLNTVGRFGSAEFSLECLAEGIWRAKSTSVMPFGGVVSFDSDGATFRFSTSRTRMAPFRRIK